MSSGSSAAIAARGSVPSSIVLMSFSTVNWTTSGTRAPRSANTSLARGDGGLDLQQVEGGLDEQHVAAAVEQPADLAPVAVLHRGDVDEVLDGRVVGVLAEAERGGPGPGPDRPDDEPRLLGGGELVAHAAGDGGGLAVELLGALAQPVLVEHPRRPAEGVGLDRVAADLEEVAVDLLEDVGAGVVAGSRGSPRGARRRGRRRSARSPAATSPSPRRTRARARTRASRNGCASSGGRRRAGGVRHGSLADGGGHGQGRTACGVGATVSSSAGTRTPGRGVVNDCTGGFATPASPVGCERGEPDNSARHSDTRWPGASAAPGACVAVGGRVVDRAPRDLARWQLDQERHVLVVVTSVAPHDPPDERQHGQSEHDRQPQPRVHVDPPVRVQLDHDTSSLTGTGARAARGEHRAPTVRCTR